MGISGRPGAGFAGGERDGDGDGDGDGEMKWGSMSCMLSFFVSLALGIVPVPCHGEQYSFRAMNASFTASDGVTVGYWVIRAVGVDANDRQRKSVMMLQTYSIVAETWVRWFGPRFTAAGFDVVAMDYRGFGLSSGPWSARTAPDAGVVYEGFRTSRFA